MRVLVTGATGYLGGAVVRSLLAAGHDVVGLVRNDDGSRLPEGVQARRGDLTDAASLAASVEGVDGVIHAGRGKDDTDGAGDLAATRALLDALAGSGRFFVHTSGTWVVGETGGKPATEDAPYNPPQALAFRVPGEEMVREAAGNGVRSSIVRPGAAYGHGGGYLPALLAPQDGAVRSFGAGENHWSVVHVDDLAEVYRLAAESAPAGSVYHAVGEVIRSGDAARAAAEAARVGVEPWPPGEAEKAWGGWADAFRLDHVVSSERARTELGWSPIGHGLIEELRAPAALPVRSGPRPETIGPRPHAQVSQQSPPDLHRQVAARALELPAVSRADSLVSVPGAIAFVLDEAAAGGPPEAFQVQREFAHLHPAEDGSLHMTLPPDVAAEAYEKGWAEPHPLSGTPLVYGPRDGDELEVVLRLLRASYEYAVGDPEVFS
jgi:nucleoside-diphosphate-sugar epimerase